MREIVCFMDKMVAQYSLGCCVVEDWDETLNDVRLGVEGLTSDYKITSLRYNITTQMILLKFS